jgi:competence protein ComEA
MPASLEEVSMFHPFRALFLVPGLACAILHAALAAAGPVNINTADAATLARELKGSGLKRAQAIVDYRGQYGPFRSADELALVKGIGPKAIEANRAEIRVETRTTPAATGSRIPAKPVPAAPTAPRPGTVSK